MPRASSNTPNAKANPSGKRSNRRVIERAGKVLSPEQVAAFEKIQKQMLEMQQAGLRMSRAMFQPGK